MTGTPPNTLSTDGLDPEAAARRDIDAMLVASGWTIQNRKAMDVWASRGVAVREFALTTGEVDYLLFVDQKPVGGLEAKKAGHTLSGVETQSEKYAAGLPKSLKPPVRPLPFLYESTGVETWFTNGLDPDPKARAVFAVHRPETLAEWLGADTLDAWVKAILPEGGLYTAADDTRPSSLLGRMTTMPPLENTRLYPNQIEAISNLELSLKKGRRRALIQMATGSGKTLMAVAALYRLIKFAGARRILFLVDRKNLGKQADGEFGAFVTPDDNRKLSELYGVQRLKSNTIGDSSKIVITTVQRMYSMLSGEPELDPGAEEESSFGRADALMKEPLAVAYSKTYPPEYFDFISRRRVPSLDLLALATGARVLRRDAHRAHGNAGKAHIRILPGQPRDGVPPRAGRG
jgi:type I restriction enzyme R subunit